MTFIGTRWTANIDWRKLVKKRLPILNWLPSYTLGMFSQDALAGVTVGLTLIPQSMAYAGVAGLPAEYGLYTAFMGCFVYMVLGTSKDITIGPTAILSLFSQSHVLAMGADTAVLLAFFCGVVVFAMGILHLGFIVDFFSYPLTSGFTSAGALTVASTQFNSLLGIPGRSNQFLDALIGVIEKIHLTKKWDATLGICTFFGLILMRQLRRFGSLKNNPKWSKTRNTIGKICFYFYLGRNAIAVAIGMLLGYVFSIHGHQPFALTGTVVTGLPQFSVPPFSTTFNNQTYTFSEMMEELGTTLIFAPAVIVLESISIAKAFSGGRNLDATQEMLALGLSNLLNSFVSGMAVTGSFSRTAVNNASGVRTPLGGLITGVMVLLSLVFIAPAAYYIPKATLAGVIICAMYYLFDYEAIITLWKTRKLDLLPFALTLFACLFLGLEYGILVGLGGNLLLVLRSNARPRIRIEKQTCLGKDIFLVTPHNNLQYPAAEFIREKIMEDCEDPKVTLIIVSGKYVRGIDATVAKNFKTLAEDLELREQKLIFWDFKNSVYQTCYGMDRGLAMSFKNGTLEDIIKETHQKEPWASCDTEISI